jgi:uncharacterized protein YkwD
MTFNLIDFLILVVVILNVLNGYGRGFILGVRDLSAWILSLVAALRFYQPLARWLSTSLNVASGWSRPIAFLVIALAATVVVHLLARVILKRLPKDVHERPANQFLGIIPGLGNGLIVGIIISALLLTIPLGERVQERARESFSVNRLAGYAERLESVLHPVFGEAISQTLNLLTIKPESNESVSLPFRVSSPQPRPDLEARMLVLVNNERTRAGLNSLTADPELTEVARHHSIDMFARGYFAHLTPEGRSPFERMREANVSYLTAGENLALAPTLQIAHNGLMNSPGHRANILHRNFGRVGIGIMDGGVHGLMITQDFRN